MDSGASGTPTRQAQELLKEKGVKPRPAPDELTKPYWDGALAHKFLLMRCSSCKRYRHPPSQSCPHCQSTEKEWTELSGDGTIYSFIVDHRNLVPGFNEPYVVALVNPVETGDDARVITNVKGCDYRDVFIGMAVHVVFDDVSPDLTLPQFVPSSPTPSE